MTNWIFPLLAACLLHFSASAQTTLKLHANQSWCVAGKGPGQDAAINPYLGQDSYVLVANLGESAFTIRIQEKGVFKREIKALPRTTERVLVPKGYVLYLDTDERATAEIAFAKP